MKILFKVILMMLVMLAGQAMAATCTSIASGSWSASSTWDCTSGNTPAAGDTVILASPFSVSLNNNNRTAAALTINAGATLNDDGQNVMITGNVVNNGTFGTNGGALIMRGTNSTLSGTGVFNDTDVQTDASGISIPVGSSMSFTNGAQLRVGRDNPGTFTLNGTINGTGLVSGDRIIRVYQNSSATINGTINAPNAYIRVEQNATLTNNGTVTVQYLDSDGNNSSSVWTQGANSSLTLSQTPANVWRGTFNASATNNTVTYTADVTPLTPSSNTYYNISHPRCAAVSGFTILGSSPCGGPVAGNLVNTYYPGTTANVPMGGASIALGAATGATAPIASGDTVLIMQMQDATIDTSNTSSYGSVSGASGGIYEYAIAASNVSLGGGTLTLACGTVNAYTNAGSSNYQVIRVPRYASAVLSSTLAAQPWNGSTGGVLMFDVTGTLNLNSATVSVDGMGFRGGASRTLPGGAGASLDYRTLATVNNNGSKGEGIAGTPRYVFSAPSTLINNGAEGYANGSHARGAPANGGGGGTDRNPAANDQNSGGGGGGNGGSGGVGGIAWCPDFNASSAPLYGCGPNTGGLGGRVVAGLGASRLTLGGGGGGGTTNNGTGTPAGGLATSGAAGGGSILIRAGSFTGSATFNANGSAGNDTVANDGSGGGGAGGVVLLLASSGMSGATVNVKGGKGGNNLMTASSTPHGPGGGGGGGYAITSSGTAACNNGGGGNGVTYNGGALFGAYGSTSGSAGSCSTSLSAAQIPGTSLGATTCGASVNHYELSLPTSGIACLPTTVTVTACADNSSPCTNALTTVAGQTATLATSAGTLASSTVTFNASGVASTTLSYPAAADGAAASLTLSGEQTAAANPRQYCPNGVSCTVASSGSTTFKTAGLIFSTAADGGEAAFSSQTAGVDFGPYWLRSVKTNTTTKTCEAAFTSPHPVNFSYQCLDPSSCSSGNSLKVGGSPALANTGATINLVFDANGNASLGSFNFADVGQIKINVSATAGGAALTGSTKEAAGSHFVVKPYSLVLTDIKQTASPNLANPAAVDAAGNKFVKAGESFSATVTSVNASCAASLGGYTLLSSIPATCITPNYGKEATPETVALSSALVAGLGLSANPTLNNATAFAPFAGGSATGTTFSWGEVGIIKLTPSVGDGNYLGAGNPGGTVSGNVGRFYPDHFDVSVNSNGTMAAACPAGGFTYTGQAMGYGTAPSLTIKPMNAATGGAVTQNYQGIFLKLAASGVSITSPTADATQLGRDGVTKTDLLAIPAMGVGTLTNSSGVITYTLNAGDQFTYTRNANALIGPYTTAIPLVVTAVLESEVSATSSLPALPQTLSPTGISMRYGRARMFNAYGSELLDLPVVFRAEYLASTAPGNAWSVNTADSCTNAALSFAPVDTPSITGNTCVLEPGNNSGKGCAAVLTSVQTNRRYLETGVTGTDSNGVAGFAGNFNLWLRAPGATRVGSIDITATVDSWLQYPWTGSTAVSPSARATFGIYKSPLIYRRENY